MGQYTGLYTDRAFKLDQLNDFQKLTLLYIIAHPKEFCGTSQFIHTSVGDLARKVKKGNNHSGFYRTLMKLQSLGFIEVERKTYGIKVSLCKDTFFSGDKTDRSHAISQRVSDGACKANELVCNTAISEDKSDPIALPLALEVTVTSPPEGKKKAFKKEKYTPEQQAEFERILVLWNSIALESGMKTHRKLTDQLRSKLHKRIDELGAAPEEFEIAFKALSLDPWNCGANERRWKASLEYAIRSGRDRDVFEDSLDNANLPKQSEDPGCFNSLKLSQESADRIDQELLAWGK